MHVLSECLLVSGCIVSASVDDFAAAAAAVAAAAIAMIS